MKSLNKLKTLAIKCGIKSSKLIKRHRLIFYHIVLSINISIDQIDLNKIQILKNKHLYHLNHTQYDICFI